MNFNSVHALTTQFEPQLYSKNDRALKDAYSVLENVLKTGKTIGAKNYTFHGFARIKKTPININYDECGYFTEKIAEKCYLTLSTVKYRIRKMLTLCSLTSRSQLVALLRRYVPEGGDF